MDTELVDADWPGWRVRSRGQLWLATRIDRTLTEREICSGLAATLIESSSECLHERLLEQYRIQGSL